MTRLVHASSLVRRALGVLIAACCASWVTPAAATETAPPGSGWFDAPSAAEDPYPPPDPANDPYPAPGTGAPAPGPGSAAAPAPEPALAAANDTDPSALTDFRPALDPYGSWQNDSTYGTVWVPNSQVVGADFAPYVSGGRWALTRDNDWIWVSDYPFGWVTFHYGRWVWIGGSGWAWVPGRTYANAWVVWRVPTSTYAYVGWAPMPPTFVWRSGIAVGFWYDPVLPYVFCPSAYVFSYYPHYYIVRDRHLVHRIATHTRVYPTPYRKPARPRPGAAPATSPRQAASGARPRGPELASARVPRDSVPRARVSPPARAVALSDVRANFQQRRPTRISPSSVDRASGPTRLDGSWRDSPATPRPERTVVRPSAVPDRTPDRTPDRRVRQSSDRDAEPSRAVRPERVDRERIRPAPSPRPLPDVRPSFDRDRSIAPRRDFAPSFPRRERRH